ncbi:MAG: endonuclease [Bacteroidia bacterium]|nr:endonuclease [Bacteroidia bacterium]
MLKKLILNIGFCAAAIASQAQALLPTSWNFSTPSISAPPAGWTLGLGTNGNLTYAFGTGDAISCRLDATGEFVTINITDKPGELSYYLSPQNAGAAWGGQFDIQESDNGATWSTLRSITTKSTTTTNFTGGKYTETNLKTTTRFIRFFYTTKLPGGVAGTPGGNMALDSVLIKAAPIASTPTIQVSRNNQIIANNSQNVVGNNATFTFKVKNVGLSDTLVIDSINFTGVSAGLYNVTNSFPIKVAANDSTNINCTLNTAGNGSRLAAINIYNNDIDKPKFTVNLYGIAGSLATEPLFSPVSLTSNNVTAYSMNLILADTSTLTENYIVLRKTGSITETPIDGQTYRRGDYIGGAQVAYIGKVGTFRPAYILANTNYSFAAFAFNGPASFENYLTSTTTNAAVSSLAGNPGAYYSTVAAPGSSNFLTTLSAKVNPHDTIFYSNYIPTVINNFLTRDTTAGKKVVNCVYTGIPYIYDEPFVWNASNSTGILTREHTRAQSTMPSNNSTQNPNWPNAGNTNRELPEFNDLHNLFPAHQTLANAPRSNNPFAECVTVTSTSPSGFGKLGKDGSGKTVYEPKDSQKGDLARAMFYMCVSYNGINGNIWTLPADQDLAVLMKWHQQDPPSAEEIARHEYIAATQKNRNPFIDNPSWANLIDFKTMTLNQGAVLTLSTLNGGESLLAGKTTNITWVASNVTGKVKLEYTTNGTDFILIDSVNVSPASYTWTVPAVATTTAKVRISTTNNSISDLSNANFTINIASLKLLTPVATDIWKGNDNRNITWQSTFVDSITIDLKDGSILLWSINEKAINGTFTIAVPNVVANNARVVVSQINGTLKDSSAVFKIEKSVGINEAANFNFTVYPNPSNGTIYFNSTINLQNSTFEIYDITGKLYVSDSFSKTNMVTLANKGVYILKANINGKTLVKKVIVE